MIQAGTIRLENGKIVPAYIEVHPDGAVDIVTADFEKVVTFTRKEIIALNNEWLEHELKIE